MSNPPSVNLSFLTENGATSESLPGSFRGSETVHGKPPALFLDIKDTKQTEVARTSFFFLETFKGELVWGR